MKKETNSSGHQKYTAHYRHAAKDFQGVCSLAKKPGAN
jgi:hypothetical protein